MIQEYLENLLGKENIKRSRDREVKLPLYLKIYGYETYFVFDKEYVFVSAKEKLNIRAYKTQQEKISEIFGMDPVLVLKESTYSQRKNLIDNRTMFIEEGRQLFMPYAGLALSKQSVPQKKQVKIFTPQIQLCALYFLYSDSGYHTVKEIEAKTGLNEMAISRAVTVLKELKVISEATDVRTKRYEVSDKRYFWQTVKRYMLNPIFKTALVKIDDLPKNSVEAGFSALSHYSVLNDDAVPTYAISKQDFKLIQEKCEVLFEDLIFGAEWVNLQIWKYPPRIFADGQFADKASVIMSFDGKDERTQSALEELERSIING